MWKKIKEFIKEYDLDARMVIMIAIGLASFIGLIAAFIGGFV